MLKLHSFTQFSNKVVVGLPKKYMTFMSQRNSLKYDVMSAATLLERLTGEEELIYKFKKLKVGAALSSECKPQKGDRKRQTR